MKLVMVTDAEDGLNRILDLEKIDCAITDKLGELPGTFVLSRDSSDLGIFIVESVAWLQLEMRKANLPAVVA